MDILHHPAHCRASLHFHHAHRSTQLGGKWEGRHFTSQARRQAECGSGYGPSFGPNTISEAPKISIAQKKRTQALPAATWTIALRHQLAEPTTTCHLFR